MSETGTRPEAEESAISDMIVLLLVGALLGIGYNVMGHRAGFGIPWKGVDRLEALEGLPKIAGDAGGSADGQGYSTDLTDPLAIPGNAASALPAIPAVGRPVQIEIGALKQYVDAGAARIIDAREPHEFEAGHIPGAINLPYDEVVTDPQRLETLETGGRPIIVYCGGGSCELSLNMAYELNMVGHDQVAVYMGGYPEWEGFGYRVEGGTR